MTFQSMFVRCLLSLLWAVVTCLAARAADVPVWLRQAAAVTPPKYDHQVPGVVLLNEARLKVEEDGRVRTVRCYAVRILNSDGRALAVAREAYLTDAGKLRTLRAWLLRASGAVVPYEKNAVLDASLVGDDLYNEVRAKSISAAADADVGDVFGYESESEERSVFLQFDWAFQDHLPVLVSRYALTGPPQWKIESVTFNRPALAPSVTGATNTWELRELPPIAPEPGSPPVSASAARLAVNVFPDAQAKNVSGRSFKSWEEVSAWLNDLSAGQAEPNEAITAKARELTATANTEFERIRALGAFVQTRIRYVSIQTGIGRGGGYRPHTAAEVFAKSYGDCKDKANLLRAMLKAAGIPAYLVTIYAGDPTYVRAAWPSPQQFNHCIIAIRVSAETQASAVVCHPAYGRLLFFDPTDEHTPVGELPAHEQTSLALLVAAATGTLETMPAAAANAHRLERRIEASLTAQGALTARWRETAHQQEAVSQSALYKRLPGVKYQQFIEAVVSGNATGAKVTKYAVNDQADAGRFTLEVEFTAGDYARNSRDKLLTFKPFVVGRRDFGLLIEEQRKQPLQLEARSFTETAQFTLPAGFEVDELPEAKTIEAEFGQFTLRCEWKDGQLLATRELALRKGLIPAEQFPAVASFLTRIRAAEEMPVVLLRK